MDKQFKCLEFLQTCHAEISRYAKMGGQVTVLTFEIRCIEDHAFLEAFIILKQP